MLMACVFGAAHALTPGHGKTLVAAYLVGERGTVWHAAVLGVVTILTHTGSRSAHRGHLFSSCWASRDVVQQQAHQRAWPGVGLLVVCMGFWLLLQRLPGEPITIHVGGGHHHQRMARQAFTNRKSAAGRRWSGALRWDLLGITGGLVPCWDAIYLLLYTVGRSQFAIALPAVLAFSAGLAGVLVLIGVLVVQVPRFAESRVGYGKGRCGALPIVAAAVGVTLIGVWLCDGGRLRKRLTAACGSLWNAARQQSRRAARDSSCA